MDIITVHINKGGTGKSTISYNLANWIAEKKNKKVLLIDGDHSCNLSYSFPNVGEETIINIFEGKPAKIYPVAKNLDFIKGSQNLKDDYLKLKDKQNNCMLMFMWIADNMDTLEQYDYIIIDTHNEPSLVTNNFLAVSDMVLGVSEPSRNGYRAWLELKSTIEQLKTILVDIRTRESYVTTKPYLIGNRLEHNTTSSKEFLETIESEPDFVGMVQKKELLAQSLLKNENIFAYDEKIIKSHELFYNNVEAVFNKILSKLK